MDPASRLTTKKVSDRTSLDVALHGRIYPDRPRRSDGQGDKPQQLVGDNNQPTLATRLAERLWTRMPLARFDESPAVETGQLVKGYVESLSGIQRLREDVVRLIGALCETNIEFRQATGTTNQPARGHALRAKVDEMVARVGVPFDPPANALNATIAAQPLQELHQSLRTALRNDLTKFAERFEGTLQHLVAQRLMGLVEWVGRNTCRYHFFTEVVLQENDGFNCAVTTTAVANSPFQQASDGSTRYLISVQHVREGVSGRHVYRWARHEHHVMNAFQAAIRNSSVRIPSAVARLVECIPEWLYDSLKIIEGDIIRERVIERDYTVKNWSDVRTRDIPIFAKDPALAIDEYVLTGWTPNEVDPDRGGQEAESHRQQDPRTARFAYGVPTPWLVGVVVAMITAVVSVAQATTRDQVLMRSAFVMFAALCAVIYIVRTNGPALTRECPYWRFPAAVPTALSFLTSGFLIAHGIHFQSASHGLIGAALFLTSSITLTRIQSHAPSPDSGNIGNPYGRNNT